jgi:hypothetical protein
VRIIGETTDYESRGCFRGERFTEKIDELIRQAPLFRDLANKLPQDRLLTFGDVRHLIEQDARFNPPALFVTATNVTGRRLEVFNSIDLQYEHVPIAKAVRASAGFPVFFRPAEFQDLQLAGWYADGGIVSNYPAWIFSNQFRIRLLESPEYSPLASRPWAHFGLRLERAPIDGDHLDASPKLYFESLARLLLVGEARTALENQLANLVTRSLTVEQPSLETGVPEGMDLLDVDKVTEGLVEDMYAFGRAAAQFIGPLDFKLPAREDIEPALARLVDRALLVLRAVDSSGKPHNSTIQFRANIFIPSRKTLFIQYAFNMSGPEDKDRDIQLQFDTGSTGFCFALRRPLICNLEQIGNLLKDEQNSSLLHNLFGMPLEQHREVRKDRTWLASVPTFDPLASYPRDLSFSDVPTPHRAAFFHSLAGRTDGAVLGVLNLDAGFSYGNLGLDADPARHWTDPRIEAILHLMTATSAELGHGLSAYFARRDGGGGPYS